MSLDEFLKTYFFPNGDRITWSTIRTHSRYDGYDNQVGFHSLMEPTIAEIILQEKHVNQTNPASAKTSKQPAIQSSERPQVEACDFVTPHVVRPGEPYWKGERVLPGWIVGCKDLRVFSRSNRVPLEISRFFWGWTKVVFKIAPPKMFDSELRFARVLRVCSTHFCWNKVTSPVFAWICLRWCFTFCQNHDWKFGAPTQDPSGKWRFIFYITSKKSSSCH